MDIRFVQSEEEAQLARNVITGFPSKTPEALLHNMAGELKKPEEGRYLGCFDDNGNLIGSSLLMDFEVNVRGKLMEMGGTAYVSTNFLHKKEHVAKNLIRVGLGAFAKTGRTVAALHPFNPAFYRKMGFGYCNETMMYSPKPQYIRSYGDKSCLSYARPEEEEEILEFYRNYAKKTHGATIHSFMDRHRIFDMPYVVVCRREGRITGYLTFEFVEVDHYTDMYHDLAVRELVCEDMETMKQFLTFFASQTDQIERVRIYTYEEDFHMLFTNPDSGENRAFDGAIQEIGRKNMGYMFRILDVKKYFALQNHCERPARREFTMELQVEDDFMEENNTSVLLRVQGDKVLLTKDREPDVVLKTGIADLSSLVMGAIPLSSFLWTERMELSNRSYGQDIQNAIGWSEKPKNYTYF
ncbi:MAG: GNAT family N-acetyltransferase [Blautia sp.]|uniref:GNAT family N-acetyltransferase n=1 Tax=Blautia argi TaxID=1912897 RepID=A0A2Z4U882_9FIRM|nr:MULTISPECIES: GNAT family N-acetyltransferase [Blautia]AWY97208.1 GNAT family N-acetyltransferase [Blautia argi]